MGPLGKGSAKGWHGLGSAAIYPEASVQRGWGFGPWLLYRFPVTLLGMGCKKRLKLLRRKCDGGVIRHMEWNVGKGYRFRSKPSGMDLQA